jgi:hypothetical protein
MEFTPEGGAFLVDVPTVGQEWGVNIPWDVAAAGWKEDGGEGEPSQDQLKAWLQDNQERFVAMIASRADPDIGSGQEADDPRVLAAEELRHI